MQEVRFNEINNDPNKYEEGDLSFKLYGYDSEQGFFAQTSQWSTDMDCLFTLKYTYDKYGHQGSSIEAYGLTVSTTYDSTFQTFPTQVAQTGERLFGIR